MKRYILLFYFLFPAMISSQQDSAKRIVPPVSDSVITSPLAKDTIAEKIKKNPYYIDSLNLVVREVVISGNEITKDEIILREMSLKRGSKFTLRKYEKDVNRIYNLGLFTKVDIIPLPAAEKEIILNVDVQERWYILPLPTGGIEEGDWKKIWIGLNTRWDNFRGRNETLGLNFRVFYNPAIEAYYSVPWIGKNLHLYSSIRTGFSRTRNRSLIALGKVSGSEAIKFEEENFDNYKFHGLLTVGKYLDEGFSVFTDYGYNYLRVSSYAPGRTVSPNGTDRYITLGAGIQYDTRNIHEFTTQGYYLKTGYKRFGFVDEAINFGRFQFEGMSFIPLNFSKEYFITFASKLYSSFAIGPVIPLYHHEYLGYGEDYVRGWQGIAFEGDNALTLYNEIRIPIFKPRYINAEKIPILRNMPIIKKLDLKHGLYFTILYDVGAVFNKHEKIKNVRFRSGTGIGLNFILPFGYIVRTEWNFRLGKPIVGKFGLSLEAKF